MPDSTKILIRLVRQALEAGYAERDGGVMPEPIELSSEELCLLGKVYSLAEGHDILPIVAHGLEYTQLPEASTEAKAAFDKHKYISVFRSNLLISEQEQLRQVFNAANIEFVLLKGAVMRTLYPEPWLRTSSDIDVLVKSHCHEEAVKILEGQLGYTLICRTSHDVSFFAPSGVHIELHFTLIEKLRVPESLEMLNRVWEYTVPSTEVSFERLLTDSMYYYYHIAHMAKHFVNGGCGIRSFIDLWLLNRSCSEVSEKRWELLTEGKLSDFAKGAGELAAVWFDGEEHTPLTEKMERYIFEGGVYGTIDNMVKIQTARVGRFKYLISRVFLPTQTLRNRYPKMGKYKILIPIMHIRRWCGLLNPKRRKRVKVELHKVGQAMTGYSADTQSLLNELNI